MFPYLSTFEASGKDELEHRPFCVSALQRITAQRWGTRRGGVGGLGAPTGWRGSADATLLPLKSKVGPEVGRTKFSSELSV